MIIVKTKRRLKTGNRNSDHDTILTIWRQHVPYVVVFVFLEFVDT